MASKKSDVLQTFQQSLPRPIAIVWRVCCANVNKSSVRKGEFSQTCDIHCLVVLPPIYVARNHKSCAYMLPELVHLPKISHNCHRVSLFMQGEHLTLPWSGKCMPRAFQGLSKLSAQQQCVRNGSMFRVSVADLTYFVNTGNPKGRIWFELKLWISCVCSYLECAVHRTVVILKLTNSLIQSSLCQSHLYWLDPIYLRGLGLLKGLVLAVWWSLNCHYPNMAPLAELVRYPHVSRYQWLMQQVVPRLHQWHLSQPCCSDSYSLVECCAWINHLYKPVGWRV